MTYIRNTHIVTDSVDNVFILLILSSYCVIGNWYENNYNINKNIKM